MTSHILSAHDCENLCTTVTFVLQGTEEGSLHVRVVPFENGKPRSEDDFIEDPTDLLDKPYQVQIKVLSAEINKSRFSKGVRVKYRVYKDEVYTETDLIRNTLTPKFNHAHVFAFNVITNDELDFFEHGSTISIVSLTYYTGVYWFLIHQFCAV